MIAFPTAVVTQLVAAPQVAATGLVTGVAGVTRAVVLESDDPQLPASTQSLIVVPRSTRVVAWEIGSAVELEHSIDLVLRVTHGDVEDANLIRDAIAGDLILRTLAVQTAASNEVDDVDGQQIGALTPFTSYDSLDPASPDAWATVTVTVRTEAPIPAS